MSKSNSRRPLAEQPNKSFQATPLRGPKRRLFSQFRAAPLRFMLAFGGAPELRRWAAKSEDTLLLDKSIHVFYAQLVLRLNAAYEYRRITDDDCSERDRDDDSCTWNV